MSSRLVELCHNDHYEVLSADGMTLPFRDNGFDITLNIAVFHHISTPERRNQVPFSAKFPILQFLVIFRRDLRSNALLSGLHRKSFQ